MEVGCEISQLTFPDRNTLRDKRAGARLIVNFGAYRHVQRMHWKYTLAAKQLALAGQLSTRAHLIWSATSTS
jgi:hypothetical protein